MSNSVKTVAAKAPKAMGQKGKTPAQQKVDVPAEEQANADEVHVAKVREAQSEGQNLSATSMAGSFDMTSAYDQADTYSLADDNDDDDGGLLGGGTDGTVLLVGAVALAGLGVAALAGGGGKKNEAPTVAAASQAVTTAEDTAKTVTVSATDPDGDPLTYTVSTAATKGTVTGGQGGTFTYTPNADFNGTDSFVVKATDDGGLSVTQTVNVTVTAVNDPPRANAATTKALTINEDTPTEVVIDFTDPEGNTPLTLAVTKAPEHGTFANIGGKNIYTPAADYNGTDSMTYTVTDSAGAVATQTVTITINAVNDAPRVANPITDQGATEASAFTYQVPANAFVDVEGSALTYTASLADGSALPAWLSFDPATRTFSGTPPQDSAGTLNIRVTASDGSLSVNDTFALAIANDITTVSLDVVGPNATTPATIAAGGDAILFTDNATVNTDVFLTGFSNNDQIRVTNATSSQYNFGTSATDANDLLVTFNSGGNFTIITIDEVLPDGAFVSTYAEAVAAVGFNFMTFA